MDLLVGDVSYFSVDILEVHIGNANCGGLEYLHGFNSLDVAVV
ncbi:hypothetical protein [Lentilactobacillus parafarraginis]|nr:hypothetical protein [Lentilactobacillus parafarraginis]